MGYNNSTGKQLHEKILKMFSYETLASEKKVKKYLLPKPNNSVLPPLAATATIKRW